MTCSQFYTWMDFYEKEPFGQYWQNWLMAIPAYMNACMHADPKKPPPKFDSFFYEDSEKRDLRVHNQRVAFFDSLDKRLKKKDG